MGQPQLPQTTEKKTRSLRLLSPKSASRLQDGVAEQMVDALIENPDPESVIRKSGSTAIQVVFAILWVLACDIRRLKNLAAVRDGFGRPRLLAHDTEELRADRELRSRRRGFEVVGDAA